MNFHYLGYYDWVVPNADNRTPDEYPYGFSAYFVWRGDVEGADVIYSDRMFEWDWEKARKSFVGFGHWQDHGKSRKKCQTVINRYYDGKLVCVGYAVCCNLATGYPIGVFYVKEKTMKTMKAKKRFKDEKRQKLYEWALTQHDHLIKGNNYTANAYCRGYHAADRGWPRHHSSYPAWAAGRDRRRSEAKET